MGQIRYEIPEELHRRLKARAALDGVSLHELVVQLLSEGLER